MSKKLLFTACLALFCAAIIPLVGNAQSWSEITATGGITARANSSSIFIPQRNEMVVFGGTSASGRESDVWVLDLSTYAWREIVSNSNPLPAPRHTQNAVYDQVNDRMLVFSGQGGGLFNDVWSFSFADSSWANLSANGNTSGVPLQRYGGVTEYDSLNGRFVTFAGFTTSGRFDDTWTFDLNGNSWNDVTPMTGPDKRCLFNSTVANDRRKMVIYGGQGSGNFDDIWSCDLDTYAWTDLTPAVKPPGRHFSSVVYRGNGEVVIFGGNGANQNNFSGARNDVWSFSMDSGSWTELIPGSSVPANRVGHVADYLPGEDKMIIFGGNLSNGTFTNDVWIFDFNSLVNIEPPVAETKIRLYPNPASETLNMDFFLTEPVDLDIRIINQQGEIVLEIQKENLQPGSVQQKLDISELASGIYFYDVVGSGIRGKFVKL